MRPQTKSRCCLSAAPLPKLKRPDPLVRASRDDLIDAAVGVGAHDPIPAYHEIVAEARMSEPRVEYFTVRAHGCSPRGLRTPAEAARKLRCPVKQAAAIL